MIKKVKKAVLSINHKPLTIAKQLVSHPLFSGSAAMIVGSNFANFLAYIYHLIIGRLLGPSPYGELAATLAALGIFSTAFVFLGLVIVKFVSSAKEEDKSILYSWFLRKGLVAGFVITLVLVILAPTVSNFLHINLKTALLMGPILFFFLMSFLLRSFLQGLLKFSQSVIVTNVDMGSRVVFGILLVYLGFFSFGAVFGIFIASVLSFLAGLFFLRDFKLKEGKKQFRYGRAVVKYAIPVLVVSFANNSFISSDVILAKHFFSPHDAGIYASLSTLGKIIFFGASPITGVMFPIISQRHSKGQSYGKILLISFMMTLGIAGGVLTIYYLVPGLMIRILFGSKFLDAAGNLFWFGLFMSVFTVSNLITSFYLSIEKTKIVFIPIIFALVQIIGILFFHDSILTVIKVSTLAATLLFVSLLLYLGYEAKKSKSSL